MKAYVFVALFALASALAPLYTHEVDKIHGSYIVVFNTEAPSLVSVSEVAQWLSAEGIKGEATHAYFLKTDTIETSFRGFGAQLDSAAVHKLRENKFVKYVEEDMIVRIPEYDTWNQTAETALESAAPTSIWGLDRSDQRCLPLNGDFNPCSGNSNTNCQGTSSVVWVVDTGVRYTHSDFGGRATLAADYASGSASAYNGDCNGHGTHVAGSAAGTTYGIAPKARIYSVRVLNCQGSGTNTGVINGFNYVGNNQVSGARNILSASLGGGKSTATNDAIESVITKGVIAVVAAGNDNADACNYSPASATNAITVGATDKTDTRASFSNYGTCVDIFGPGVSVTSAWYTSDTASNTISGTSMATPYVSGAVAVQAGTVTNAQTKTNIKSYGTKNVVKSAGTGSPNILTYDRWNQDTSYAC